jgi:hypothetical protein
MYELWQVVDNEPLFLLKSDNNFDKIYEAFSKKIKESPCLIAHSKEGELYIYESSDNGKTIYKRRFGDYKNKILVEGKNE